MPIAMLEECSDVTLHVLLKLFRWHHKQKYKPFISFLTKTCFVLRLRDRGFEIYREIFQRYMKFAACMYCYHSIILAIVF